MADRTPEISLAYVAAMLRRAEAFAEADPRGAARAERWRHVMDGVVTGALDVGSRAPLRGLPPWLTPEIAHGGFATGRLALEGPLDASESALAERHGVESTVLALNLAFCTERGGAALLAAARSGQLRVDLPEQAALATVAWLQSVGRAADADEVLGRIAPHFARVRFFPRFGPPRDADGAVHLGTVADLGELLARLAESGPIAAMRETLRVWRPLTERVVAYAMAAPALEVTGLEVAGLAAGADEEGEGAAPPSGDAAERPSGPADGHPPSHAAWHAGIAPLLAAVEAARAHAWRSTRHLRATENLGGLVALLARAAAASPTAADHGLGPRGLARMRELCQRWCAKHGAPGSAERARRAAREREAAELPSFEDAARLLFARIATLDPTDGVEAPVALFAPPEADERAHFQRGAPTLAVPPRIRRAVDRARRGPLEDLVRAGVLTSLEQVAEVLPMAVAEILGASVDDPAGGALLRDSYVAFRRRRTLLLLNLASQVRFGELPWVAAIQTAQRAGAAEEVARATVRRVAAVALEHFPETPLPNPLVSELATLTDAAGTTEPWTEALAADIFMGRFAPKFGAACLRAAEQLAGTPYDLAYGLDLSGVAKVLARGNPGARALHFQELCADLAGRGARATNSVAWRGRVIEAGQVLTAHNVPLLYGDAEALHAFRERYGPAARAAFDAFLGTPLAGRGGRLAPEDRRRAAAALRQALALVSLGPDAPAEVARWCAAFDAAAPEVRAEHADVREALGAAARGERHRGAPYLGWFSSS